MIYLSLGSNLGNRLVNLQNALKQLRKIVDVIHVSPVIETEALLPEAAKASWNKPYFNMVVGATSTQSPENLFSLLQEIEQKLGREKIREKWSPRTIDIDILLINDKIVESPTLKIPHPELLNRPFLIHLLAMMAGNLQHPLLHQTFIEMAYHRRDILTCFKRSFVVSPQLIGVVNITPDSFSDGGKYFNTKDAIQRALQLHHEGASIIELGAQSTKPDANIISAEEEYQRLHPILEALLPDIQKNEIQLSIDSFYPEIILKLLENYPIAWINDVKGQLPKSCLLEIAKSNCGIIMMHALSIPPNQQTLLPFHPTPIKVIYEWMQQKLSDLRECGFSLDKIILDPGIGFNKTPYQSLNLLQEISQLTSLECALCIGHSRKSFITIFNTIPAPERDVETLAISAYLTKIGIDYLRVHNIADHQRFQVASHLAIT